MVTLKIKPAAGVLKLALTGLILLAATISASAATTYDWTGASGTSWTTPGNWKVGGVVQTVNYPGKAVTDIAQIGVTYSFTNQPTLSSGATNTIANLTFGTQTNTTLTVSSGSVLAVTGAIVQNPNANGNITTTLAGTGAITGASLQVGNTTLFLSLFATYLTEVISTINSFHITGNVSVNSTALSALFISAGLINATFSLEGGTTTIDGTILTTNTTSGLLPLLSATPTFSVDIPSGSALSPVLQLTNASPINTSSLAGSIDFYNNTGGTGTSTVYYSGTSQQVYANTTASLDNTPQTYQYLQLTGSGTKTVNAGTLTVGNDLTSSATTVLLNTNNTVVTVGGSWSNSSNVTQGSGDITVTNAVQNTAGTFQLGTGNLTTATLQNSGGTMAGGAGPGVVTVSGTFQNNGGTFQCNAENDYFNGLYQNTSTFTAGTGTVYFNGSAAQSLSDISSAGTQFNKVSFSGTSLANPKTMSGSGGFSVSPTGFLYMVGSTTKLVAGTSSAAYLTLKSDTTGAATVTNIPSGSTISGFVTVQRFVQGNKTFDVPTNRWIGRNYRLMSSPVNEGADASSNYPCSLNYLGASTIITDCTSTYATKGGNPSLYLFNEHYTPSNTTFTSGNFIGVTNISNTAASGTITTTDATNGTGKVYAGGGYMIYFRGDNITHLSGSPNKTTYPYVAPESVTFSATGNLNQGTYAVVSWTGTAGLMYTTSNGGNSTVRGYNLAGNPYASSIDWSTFSNSNPAAAIYGKNVNPTVYVFNPTTSQYASYNASTGLTANGGSKTIPSGQGFFVQANAASPTLTFNESAKTNTVLTGSNLLMGAPASQLAYTSFMKLDLITDSINKDEMVIGFNSSSTTKYNPNEDSEFLPGVRSAESIAGISSDSVQTTAKWLPFPNNTSCQVLKLYVTVAATGTYTIRRTDLEAIPQIYDLWLKDNYKKDSLDIRNNTTYVFDIDLTDTASYGSNRFEIVVRQNPALSIHLLNFTASKTSGGSQIVWLTENEQNYTNFTVERSTDGGQTFTVLGGVASSALGTYSYLDKNPPVSSDMYRLKIQDLNGTITYSNMVTLTYGNSNRVTASNISIYPNPSNGLLNLAITQTSGSQQPGLSGLQNIGLTPSLAANTSYDIEIISITGAVVKSATSASASWQDNVSGLTPGTYIIQVVNDKDKSVVGKSTFVKM